MSGGEAITAFPAGAARPPGFPDDLPFLGGVPCWVVRRMDRTIVIWHGAQPAAPGTEPAGLSRRDIEQVIREAGGDREAMKQSLVDLLARQRAAGSPVAPAAAGATAEHLERLAQQLSDGGWAPVAAAGAPDASRAFRRGDALRVLTADGGRGVVMLYESRVTPPPP